MNKLPQVTSICFTFLIGIFTSCNQVEHQNENSAKPNVLIILADDLGYGDLECYSEKSLIPTPHLNKLAASGLRFTNAYCPVSVCSPTRYALMTGNYPWRSWKKKGVMSNYEPSMIDSALTTLPELMKKAGYHTAGFGKWHLGTSFSTLDGNQPAGYGKFYAANNGENLDLSQPVSDGPNDHGFDQWMGFSCASECWVFENTKIYGALQHEKYTTEAAPNQEHIQKIPLEEYLEVVTNKTIQYLKNLSGETPFFLYYAPYVPHIPLSVSQEFRGKTKAGLYGDYVHELDHYIGKVLSELDKSGLSENTIVLFASDNGSQFKVTNSQMELEKAGNSPRDSLVVVIDEDTHQPNANLRGTKWTAWEGGVRTPFIIRWPGKTPEGKVSEQLFALNDIISSLAGIIRAKVPENSAVDSYNMAPVWRGKEEAVREEVIIQSSGNRFGIRRGNWKYICSVNFESYTLDDTKAELYNLETDVSEQENLIGIQLDVGNELKSIMLRKMNLKAATN
ncbi:sulfatase family protein [Flexithrix dorotheae]|uniref:sulfatase family protein n=1 Tax=Flexithrix dorotheae TaxID=70993 RepID=UPI000364941B|nr:arylsulfatase [Flexithrix dorotheae]